MAKIFPFVDIDIINACDIIQVHPQLRVGAKQGEKRMNMRLVINDGDAQLAPALGVTKEQKLRYEAASRHFGAKGNTAAHRPRRGQASRTMSGWFSVLQRTPQVPSSLKLVGNE